MEHCESCINYYEEEYIKQGGWMTRIRRKCKLNLDLNSYKCSKFKPNESLKKTLEQIEKADLRILEDD